MLLRYCLYRLPKVQKTSDMTSNREILSHYITFSITTFIQAYVNIVMALVKNPCS